MFYINQIFHSKRLHVVTLILFHLSFDPPPPPLITLTCVPENDQYGTLAACRYHYPLPFYNFDLCTWGRHYGLSLPVVTITPLPFYNLDLCTWGRPLWDSRCHSLPLSPPFITLTFIPEDDHYGTLAASDHHQSFPDHQGWGHNHTKVQHLVIQLKNK